MNWSVEEIKEGDWPAALEIYAQGIATGNATFETTVPVLEHFKEKFKKLPRLVVRFDNALLGWAMLSAVSSRCVYEGVAEVSVYVHRDFQGQGLGLALLKEMVKCSESLGLWTLQAHLFPENLASLRIHERAGFRRVGYREKLGRQHGRWRDVLLLERRSPGLK